MTFLNSKLTQTIKHLDEQIRDVEARIEVLPMSVTLKQFLLCRVWESVLLLLFWLRLATLNVFLTESKSQLGLGLLLLFISQLVYAFWGRLLGGVLSG